MTKIVASPNSSDKIRPPPPKSSDQKRSTLSDFNPHALLLNTPLKYHYVITIKKQNKKRLFQFIFSKSVSCHAGLIPKGRLHISLFKTFVDLPTDGPFYKQQLTKQQQQLTFDEKMKYWSLMGYILIKGVFTNKV